MAGDHEDEVFCEKEQRNFPRSDFEVDEKWGLVHNVRPRHTKEGTIIYGPPKQVPEPQIERPLDTN